ncbi:MAG TPA: rod shape-determining protein RodA [Acidimicrobiales bacterium]|nr:rod shape-determining protein RodA [Acidimicrobiales bacterium]
MALADTLNRRTLGSLHEDPAAPRKHIDIALIVVTGLLSLIGLALIYSARHRHLLDSGLDPFYYVKRQGFALFVGGIAFVIIASIDYRKYREWALYLFGASTAFLLVVVSPLGSRSNGSQAWFQVGSFQLQPSEIAKITLIVALAAFAAAGNGHLDRRRLGVALLIALVPAGLIMLQPDLGSALVLAAITMGTLLVAGARPRHIVVLTLLGLISVAAILQTDTLKQYQRDRLTAFVDQGTQPAYQQTQSKIAFGAGGVTGQGYLKGTQTNLSYVPEQHTDFIFTVAGEELGFVGVSIIMFLYAVLAWRIWRIGTLSRDLFGMLVCAGALSLLVFQLFENIGMTTGIMPITGIPLPLLSYGGSSTLAFLAMIGLVESVHMHRFI